MGQWIDRRCASRQRASLCGLDLGLIGAMKAMFTLCKWFSTFLLMLNRHFLVLSLWEWWEWWSSCWLGPEREEKNKRWERDCVYNTKDEPPTNLCPSSKCCSVASHHLEPCGIIHANWSVWPFITFPGVVFYIFLLRVPQNSDMLSFGPGFGGNLWCENFPGKQQCSFASPTKTKWPRSDSGKISFW